jgi:hypothetical protein
MTRSSDVTADGRLDSAALSSMPSVYCPFPPRISPYVADAQRYAVEWATRQGLLDTDSTAAGSFAAARLAHLMARTFPDATHPDLCLATAWLTVVFRLDDHLETALGRDPSRLRTAGEALLRFFAGWPKESRPPAAARRALGRPLCGALADVWRRTAARLSPAWRARFVGHVEEYLAGTAWEAGNRRAGRVPDPAEYIEMRRHTAATGLFFDLIEVFRGVEVPEPTWRNPALRTLRGYADNAVAWFNDLVSWPKELRRGDRHNLVLVLGHHTGCSLDEAVRAAARYHDGQVRGFVAAREAMPLDLLNHSGVAGVVADLAHWIRGNMDWSRETGRYAPVQA